MENKGLTLSIIFEAESANYGEGFGNISSLKKMSRGDGYSYSYISRQALGYNIRKQLKWNNTPVSDKDKVVQHDKDASIKDYPEIDLFGYMKTGKNSIIFTLPKPMLESFEEMNLERLLNIIVQVSSNTIPQKMGNDEKEELLTHIKKCIKDKYNIDVEYNNGKIEIYNAID